MAESFVLASNLRPRSELDGWTLASFLAPEPWVQEALCAETEPDAFFPEKGGTTLPAKAVCAACDVREQCLEFALRTRQKYGIYGGTSPRERARLLKNREAA